MKSTQRATHRYPAYGDLSLTVIAGSVVPIEGQAGTELHYSYELTNGRLTTARASGPGADLVVEVLVRDKYRCEAVERMSVLEAMGDRTHGSRSGAAGL